MKEDAVKRYRQRKYLRLMSRLDSDDEEGRWITTKNGHKVHLNESGEPDIGNKHVIEKMSGGGSSSAKSDNDISSKSMITGKTITLNSLKDAARKIKTGSSNELIQDAMDLAFDHPEKFYDIVDALGPHGDLAEQFMFEMGPSNTNGIEDVFKPAIEAKKNELKKMIPSPAKNKSSSTVLDGKKITFSNVRNAMYPNNSKQQRFIDISIEDVNTGERIGSYAENDYDSAMEHIYDIVGLKTKSVWL